MSTQLPPVIGDPSGMRALAAALRSTAGQVEAVDAAVNGRVSGLAFTGPAATRLCETVSGWHRSVSATTASLEDAGALLERSAAEVEAEQAARARLEERLYESERNAR